jgi:hypothetical protein
MYSFPSKHFVSNCLQLVAWKRHVHVICYNGILAVAYQRTSGSESIIPAFRRHVTMYTSINKNPCSAYIIQEQKQQKMGNKSAGKLRKKHICRAKDKRQVILLKKNSDF